MLLSIKWNKTLFSTKRIKTYKNTLRCDTMHRITKMGVHDMKLNTSIVQEHELSKITSHIDKIVNIYLQCKVRPTALHTAVLHNNVKVAALLLQHRANMMITPFAKRFPKEFECTLLMAFKQDESHEDMQFLLLRHLSDCSRDQFDSVVLKNIARVAQYAMLYCSQRVFFAAEEMKTKMIVVNPTGFTPLMFTIHRPDPSKTSQGCAQTYGSGWRIQRKWPYQLKSCCS